MKIASIVGARPQFMKLSMLSKALQRNIGFEHFIIHTGQHYNEMLSDVFFEELGIDEPKYNLGIGSMLRSKQIAEMTTAIAQVLKKEKPDLVIVYGDTNSTLAGARAASRAGIKLAHVEAGLRSFDRTMPEEINRIETDKRSALLFATEEVALENLWKEGVKGKAFLVGDVMIDCLREHLPKAERSGILESLELDSKNYCLATLHRPSNVDSKQVLSGILKALLSIAEERKVILSMHPRTRKKIREFSLEGKLKEISVIKPLGYLDFVKLLSECFLVISDSGSIQSEAAFLGKQCITLRYNTERPFTVESGFNILAGNKPEKIMNVFNEIKGRKKPEKLLLREWDGKAAERIVSIMKSH